MPAPLPSGELNSLCVCDECGTFGRAFMATDRKIRCAKCDCKRIGRAVVAHQMLVSFIVWLAAVFVVAIVVAVFSRQ